MLKYLLGLFKHLFNPGVSIYSLIDNLSIVNRKAKVYRKTRILKSHIGAYSYICKGTSLVHVDIGKFCSIAEDCLIGIGNHKLSTLSSSPIFYSQKNATGHTWVYSNYPNEFKPIVIGNDVWIGCRVIIFGGVRIGNGAIVGAGTIVTKDVPDYAIVAGIPARILRYRFENAIINKLLELEWWNYSERDLKEILNIFQLNSISEDVLNSIKK